MLSYKKFLELAKKHEYPKGFIQIEWTTGGMTGRSCWGGEITCPVTAESEPEFKSLDAILEEVSPKISMLQYKKLLREVVKEDNDTSSDYYGNYTSSSNKTIDLKELYEWLKNNDLLS